MRILSSVALLAGLAPAWATAVIIDHDDMASVATLSQTAMDLVGQQRWFFTHASVGGNMVAGMNNLHTANPVRYKFVTSGVGYNSAGQRASAPPVSTAAGTIYECSRGNPGWEDKVAIFANSVNTSAWRSPKVDVVLDKFCYIDETAVATDYLNSMSALETSDPSTRFVYATMPLMTSADAANILRNDFNTAVRAHCTGNSRILFDIADMEAYDPAGNPVTFVSGGKTYQKLYSGYTDDGGHLDSDGQQRIALGWYATAAEIAGVLHQMRWIEDGSGNWTEAHWDGAPPACPDSTKDAIVDRAYTVTVNSASAARSLTLSNGGEVAIAAGGSLSVANEVVIHAGTARGRLTLASGTALTAARVQLSGGALSGSGAVSLPISIDSEGGSLEVISGSLALNGAVTGPGVLTFSGGGTLTLSDHNAYGGTVVQSGSLVVAAVQALPTGRSLTIQSGGAVVLQSGLTPGAVQTAATSVAVPEPGTAALLVALVIAMLAWRRGVRALRCG